VVAPPFPPLRERRLAPANSVNAIDEVTPINIEELLKRPCHIILQRDETDDHQVGWVASVAEPPGCLAQGRTPADAAERIYDAMELWFEGTLEKGSPIPEPREMVTNDTIPVARRFAASG
jgi:predicted RNase H-like HicB family nuclease